jgi:hypothetical protein
VRLDRRSSVRTFFNGQLDEEAIMFNKAVRTQKNADNEVARDVNMALGTWLMVSNFLWHHDGLQFLIASLVGLVVVLTAPFASPWVRYLNTAAGLALAASALFLPRLSTATTWHNGLVGLAIAAVSLASPHESNASRAAHSHA